MGSCKILYVSQEVAPYLPETEMSVLCRTLAQNMHERGHQIRAFMPRYGCVNERRNQLHEVIRLSGMNLIIDDNDHQLIIKVASIPSSRVQIYFIDNNDYFSRKAVVKDPDGSYFPDNDERAMFFARGVLEIVRKLLWAPTIVHCHGWLSAMVPVYLRHTMADDPIFKDSKIVISLYDESFSGTLDPGFAGKLSGEGIESDKTGLLGDPTYVNLMKFVTSYADGIVVEAKNPDAELSEWIGGLGVPVLGRQDKSTKAYLDNYQEFYGKLL